MQTPEYQPDPRVVAAVHDLADQIRHDARVARQARPELARSFRAFIGPALRVLGGVGLIAMVALAEVERQHRSSSE